MTPSQRINQIYLRILSEEVEKAKNECIKRGVPADAFNSSLAERQIEKYPKTRMDAICEYLDEKESQ